MGLVEGVAEAIASLLKTYSGAWSDSISRRKPFIIAGYLLSALSKPFIGASHSWVDVLGARAADRMGKGIRSAPRDALISDSVSPSFRGAAFGWHRGMDTLGAAVGPLFAILILSINRQDLRSLYYWALIPGLISVFIIFFVRESKPLIAVKKKWISPLKGWGELSSDFKKYIIAWGVFSLTNSSDVFLLMKAKISAGLSIETVILIFCSYNLIYSLSSPYLGKLSDRMDRRNILILGLIIFLFSYLGFGFASQPWHFWVLFAIYGLYMGATDGVGKALAIDLSTESLKATGLGILGTVSGVCTVLASFFAGLIWDHYGSFWTFAYGGLGAFCCILLLVKTSRKPRLLR